MRQFKCATAAAQALRPESPVYCIHPPAVDAAARWFLQRFPGRTLFAVKTNPLFIPHLAAAGLDHFEVASLEEAASVRRACPAARLSFMHPVKSRQSIRRAYHDYGVRDFALDSPAELHKILDETDGAQDLNLFLRLSVSNRHSCLDLSGKFGIDGVAAERLLLETRQVAATLGVCFHAGSQLLDPAAFKAAMGRVSALIRRAGVMIDVLDVGGGFPAAYPGMTPPPLERFVAAIKQGFATMLVGERCELWCEPGRALVAEAASLLLRVEARKGNLLYLNDGTYGGLFDAGRPGFRFPAALAWRAGGTDPVPHLEKFSFYGPTCDSLDYMPGPFLLPADIAEGDYVELGNLGAYSMQLRTDFNGFGHYDTVTVEEGPMLSMYGIARRPAGPLGVAEAAARYEAESGSKMQKGGAP